MNPKPRTFVHEITVRFQEVDRAGIAFFGRIFEYCHVAWEELMNHIGLRDVFGAEGWGMPLVHAEADFSQPLRLSERIAVTIHVGGCGEKSITFEFTLHGVEEGDKRAVARHVHAFVELATLTPRSFPESLRHALIREGLIAIDD